MGGGTYVFKNMPEKPLDAAAQFQVEIVPLIRNDFAMMPDFNVTVIFQPAGHEHRAWRLAMIQELAREAAPQGRVNGIVGNDEGPTMETVHWLQESPGITGQLLAVD